MFSRLCARPPSPTLSKVSLGGRGGAEARDMEEEEVEEVEMLGAEVWDTRGRFRAGRGGGISDTEREDMSGEHGAIPLSIVWLDEDKTLSSALSETDVEGPAVAGSARFTCLKKEDMEEGPAVEPSAPDVEGPAVAGSAGVTGTACLTSLKNE
ncbi:hypothetical protein E2C01_033389 [Portunus trituberculatus]|uniref:Uncharacterized protein n=1 Tax=Portunus trituberculatus TaxID=210409 RepID=A0A5B7EYK0_PORTR|nr:hypothetical protein [Portunus trituberculatus]